MSKLREFGNSLLTTEASLLTNVFFKINCYSVLLLRATDTDSDWNGKYYKDVAGYGELHRTKETGEQDSEQANIKQL